MVGNENATKLLLDAGADPNMSSMHEDAMWTPICLAAKYNHPHVIQQLLDNGADLAKPVAEGMTALHWAAIQGSLGAARCLLMHDSSIINNKVIGRFTPLMCAIIAHESRSRHSNVPMVELLIKFGVDVNITVNGRSGGYSAISAAACRGHVSTMKVLLNAGAVVHKSDILRVIEHNQAYTATISQQYSSAVELILENEGTTSNLADSDYEASLITAALGKGKFQIANVLMRHVLWHMH